MSLEREPFDALGPYAPPRALPTTPEERVFLGVEGDWPVIGHVEVVERLAPSQMSTIELVRDLKARAAGRDPTTMWGVFVAARHLRPEIDMKDFAAAWERATPVRAEARSRLPFAPQWYDTLRRTLLQTSSGAEGVVRLLWADGGTGSMPAASRGANLIEHLAPLPQRAGLRYGVGKLPAGGFIVVDRWGGRSFHGFRAEAGAVEIARRLDVANALRWEVLGFAWPVAA